MNWRPRGVRTVRVRLASGSSSPSPTDLRFFFWTRARRARSEVNSSSTIFSMKRTMSAITFWLFGGRPPVRPRLRLMV